MKQAYMIMLTIFLCGSMCLFAFADEASDSLSVSDTEKQAVQFMPIDHVVKLYSTSFTDKFAQGKSIVDVVNDESVFIIYMVAGDKGPLAYRKLLDDGRALSLDLTIILDGWKTLYPYIVAPEKILGDEITVQQVYCIHGDANYDGACIYYATDEGDYVLYKGWSGAEEAYLIDMDTFYLITEAVHIEKEHTSMGSAVGTVGLGDVWDLEPYKIGGEQIPVLAPNESNGVGSNMSIGSEKSLFDWTVLAVVCAVIALAAGCAFAVGLHQRCKKQ